MRLSQGMERCIRVWNRFIKTFWPSTIHLTSPELITVSIKTIFGKMTSIAIIWYWLHNHTIWQDLPKLNCSNRDQLHSKGLSSLVFLVNLDFHLNIMREKNEGIKGT